MKKRLLSVLLAAAALAFTVCACSAEKKEKVLFIGNSFTYYSEMPEIFASVAESAGKSVKVEYVTQGSWNLTKFADADDEYGGKVDEKLNIYGDYTAVVLQEQSTRPLNNYSLFLKAAGDLKSKIDSTQISCGVYLYSTWGYEEEAEKRNLTIPQMEEKIRAAYEKVAAAVGAEVSPAGKAFSAVFTAYPDINLYHSDGKHPSYAGAYLAAFVHVAAVLKTDPRAADFNGELDGQTAEILRAEAYKAVYGN